MTRERQGTYERANGDESDGFSLLDRARLGREVDDDLTSVHRRRYRQLDARCRVPVDAARRHHDARQHRVLRAPNQQQSLQSSSRTPHRFRLLENIDRHELCENG